MAIVSPLTSSLSEEEILSYVQDQFADGRFDGATVCVVVPDATRSCPLALLVDAVHGALHGRVARLRVLIALGTHAAMTDDHIARMFETSSWDELLLRYPDTEFVNHEWWKPEELVHVGTVPAARLRELSEGRLDRSVDVSINRSAADFDELVIVGPVFPHEVVGFSGGNKYLFPGISGQEMIDVSHWLGALISSSKIIGTLGITPVRALINEAASFVPARVSALCVVVRSGTHDLFAVTSGDAQTAWAEAARVSAQVHVQYVDEPVSRVLSLVPERYDELWTGAKGMYKVEPIVADGGEVIVYAPHIDTVSFTHGPEIAAVGYHVRDYFTGQWERFKNEPWGVLAHSTHVRGGGTWTEEGGENGRIRVILATGISREETERIGLEYLDPATVDIEAAQADPATFVVPNAGEVLFRLASERPD
ncbi:lactate racemase domain-containing protein [Microbacterium sp. K24]|uniref:lactate racemase domain-containing protein n=1 Tax=Microbacterium sp. K24 TaxID=2305446 RepID=UPI00109C44C4|nr:lactate racemase domain-containing protein [Microbacterium sp. K24]